MRRYVAVTGYSVNTHSEHVPQVPHTKTPTPASDVSIQSVMGPEAPSLLTLSRSRSRSHLGPGHGTGGSSFVTVDPPCGIVFLSRTNATRAARAALVLVTVFAVMILVLAVFELAALPARFVVVTLEARAVTGSVAWSARRPRRRWIFAVAEDPRGRDTSANPAVHAGVRVHVPRRSFWSRSLGLSFFLEQLLDRHGAIQPWMSQ